MIFAALCKQSKWTICKAAKRSYPRVGPMRLGEVISHQMPKAAVFADSWSKIHNVMELSKDAGE